MAESAVPSAFQSLATSDSGVRRIGVLILVVTFGLFGGWAALAPLESAALAPGVVTVKNYRKTIQHLEGGIVRDIRVREGTSVTVGEPLLVLDDTQFRAERQLLRGQYLSLRALEARLVAERAGLQQVSYPRALLDDGDPWAAEAVASQDAVFNARRTARAGERAVLEQRVEQLQSQIAGIRAVYDSNLTLVASYENEMAELQVLRDKGFTGKQRLTEIERDHARVLGENAEALADIAANEIRIGETRLQILQLDKYQQTEIADQLGTTQADINDLAERLRVIEDKLARTVVRAPVSGVVLGMSVHTVGGVVAPGTTLLDIVPENQQLMVDAEVSPVDIDRVQQGTPARIRFSAFSSAVTPMVDGDVVSVSADRMRNPDTGMPYYLAQVEVMPPAAGEADDFLLVPGMPAEVLINTGYRTFLQYLLQPASNMVARSLIED